MNPDKSRLYVLFSNHKFAWIYSFKFNADDTIDSLDEDDKPALVIQSSAKAVYWLGKSQLVI